ncbi:MAG TPA: hypothetical protein VF262_10065, partial [Burkholderiales bacterium]
MRRACLGLLLLWAAVAAAQPNLAPGFTKLPPNSTIALMPADVELFEMSAGGINEPRADWTAAANKNIMADLRARKQRLGARATEITDDQDEAVEALNNLHGAVASAIVVHHFGTLKLPTKDGKLDWTLGPDATKLRDKSGADYALFTWVRDSYASAERKAMMVVGALLGVGMTAGVQQAYASLVDLRTGQVVRFNRIVRGTGDLREPEPAAETLTALLTGFPL